MDSVSKRISLDDLTESDSGDEMKLDEGMAAPMPTNNSKSKPAVVVAEVFCGKGVLSRACQSYGLQIQKYDLHLNAAHDMSSIRFAQNMAQNMLLANVVYSHFAPPCNTFSGARYPKLRILALCYAMFYLLRE